MKYVGSIVGLWLITLVFARFRLHRRMLTNARAARKARLEKHKELLSKMREKRQSNGKLASRTLTKDDELRSDEGVVQSKLSLAWVRGEDDAENDDRPPQEGGEVRALKQTVSMKMPTYAAATTLDASTMKKEYLVAREASHAKALDVLTNIRAPAMPPKLVSMPSMQHEVAHRKLQSRVPIASASLGDDGWAPASRPSRQVDSSDLKNDNPVPIARVGPDAVWAPASRPISKLSRRGQGQSGLEHLVLTPASLPQPPSRSPTGRRRIGDPARNLTVKPGRSRVEPPTGSADISNVEGREERRDLVDPPPPDASNALALHSASCKPHIPALTPTVRSNVLAADNITSDGKEGLGATQTLTFSWKRATAKAHVQGDKSSMADVVMVASLYRRGSSGHISAAAYANEKASAAAASARAKAKKSVRDVGEIFHLIRTCQLKTLTQRVLNYVGNWFKKLVSTARGEHTVVSFLWPTDIDGALFDTQCVQIFWNVLVLESVLLAMLFSNLPSQVSPTLVTLIIQALITVFPCVVAAGRQSRPAAPGRSRARAHQVRTKGGGHLRSLSRMEGEQDKAKEVTGRASRVDKVCLRMVLGIVYVCGVPAHAHDIRHDLWREKNAVVLAQHRALPLQRFFDYRADRDSPHYSDSGKGLGLPLANPDRSNQQSSVWTAAVVVAYTSLPHRPTLSASRSSLAPCRSMA
eukprot:scaffold63472_cov33-Tisochrysis_lutea.AAC.1